MKSICDALNRCTADVDSSPQSTRTNKRTAALPLQTSRSRILKPNFSVSSSEPTPIKQARSNALLTPPCGMASSSKDVVHISDSPVKQKGHDLGWLDRATMEMKRRSPDGAKATEVPNYTYQVFKNKKTTFKKPAAAGKAATKKAAASECVIGWLHIPHWRLEDVTHCRQIRRQRR